MPRAPKQAFTELAGLPRSDDPEVATLMDAVSTLSRDATGTVIRNLMRAALGWERTRDSRYLECYAEDTLFTMRLRNDPEFKADISDVRTPTPERGEPLDVEQVLGRLGLA